MIEFNDRLKRSGRLLSKDYHQIRDRLTHEDRSAIWNDWIEDTKTSFVTTGRIVRETVNLLRKDSHGRKEYHLARGQCKMLSDYLFYMATPLPVWRNRVLSNWRTQPLVWGHGLIRDICYGLERAKYGISLRDTWNFENYLTSVVIAGLTSMMSASLYEEPDEELELFWKSSHGTSSYPHNSNDPNRASYEAWVITVSQIIAGFLRMRS